MKHGHNLTIQQNMARVIVAVTQLDRMGCVVLRVESSLQQPRIDVLADEAGKLRGRMVKTLAVQGCHLRTYSTEIEGCHVQWDVREAWDRRASASIPTEHDDDLTPVETELLRDITRDVLRNGVDA